MTRATRQRDGFTLGEVLVTVAIVAILAAVTIPTIASQMRKGDIGRTTNDLVNVRTGVEQFLADVRRFPFNPAQLTRKITTAAADTSIVGGVYTTAQVNRWAGPYVVKDSNNILNTGFGGVGARTFAQMTINGQNYLAWYVTGIDTLSMMAIDVAMDDGTKGTGSIQWTQTVAAGVTYDTLKFLIVPIQ